MSRIAYRHGDVVILPISGDALELVHHHNKHSKIFPEDEHTMEVTLATGEVTGHSHVLENVVGYYDQLESDWRDREWIETVAKAVGIAGGVATRRIDWSTREDIVEEQAPTLPTDAKLVTIGDGGGALTHQEHATINLPAGDYITFQQREFWGKEERRVFD